MAEAEGVRSISNVPRELNLMPHIAISCQMAVATVATVAAGTAAAEMVGAAGTGEEEGTESELPNDPFRRGSK